MRTWGKIVSFGWILENKFKVLNSDQKKWLSGTHLGLRTFVGDLFKRNAWGYDLFYQESNDEIYEELKASAEVVVHEVKATKPIEEVKFQDAVVGLSALVEKAPMPIVRENIELSSETWTNFELSPDILNLKVEDSEVLVFFVGLNETSAENKNPNEKQLELVQNMAKAMNLAPSEYKILTLSAGYFDRDDLEKINPLEERELKEIIQQIYATRPKIIYSLGANVTNFFLKRREKLSVLHGNVVEIRFVGQNNEKIFQTLVMPLFHPELLIINPNMKRTTWIDLQKSLPYIGKN